MAASLRAIMGPVTSLRAARAAANLLHRPPGQTPEAIVARLLAVQSQDLIQGRRALRARGGGFTAADVDRAIAEERSIVLAWFNRGTLFMVAREDYWWLLPLTAPPRFTGSWTRLAQNGVSPDDAERGWRAMEAAPPRRGPPSRNALRDAVAAA